MSRVSTANTIAFQGKSLSEEVIEVGLLLPRTRAVALVELAGRRGESVGQILRRLVDEALDPRNDRE